MNLQDLIDILTEAIVSHGLDPNSEVQVRVDDNGHGFDLEGCFIDRVRLAVTDPDNGGMTAPVEIVVNTP